MANLRGKGKVLGLNQLEVELLPIAVRTITVNAKQLTPAFYKQLTEEPIIDEHTGELRGFPLGYYHVHAKTCPEVPHKHVLWSTEREPHLVTVVLREHDSHYLKQQELSTQKREGLIHLLALLLALADQPFTHEWDSGEKRKVAFAGYTLYLSADAARPLARLDEIREQYKEDHTAWQNEQKMAQESQIPLASEGEQRTKAQALLTQLTEQGGEITHSALRSLKADKSLDRYYSYQDNLEAMGWYAYPRGSNGEKRKALFYWREVDLVQRGRKTEPLRTLIESHLDTLISPVFLRMLLAERRLETEKQEIRDLSQKLVSEGLLPRKKGKPVVNGVPASEESSSLDVEPDQVWRAYQQELRRFKTVTQQWDKQLEELQRVEQLFLIS